MTWLARIELGTPVLARLGLGDSYAWHKALWGCFPGQPDHDRDFLSRIDYLEGAARAWILAEREPTRPAWCPPDAFTCRPVAPGFLGHRYYAFDLRANPTRALVQRDAQGTPAARADGRRRSGKRVPLVAQDQLRRWIERKGEQGGFRLADHAALDISPMVPIHFRKGGAAGYHGSVQYRGILEVTDPERFAESYSHGIGSGKAFGFGLLLLAPIHQ